MVITWQFFYNLATSNFTYDLNLELGYESISNE